MRPPMTSPIASTSIRPRCSFRQSRQRRTRNTFSMTKRRPPTRTTIDGHPKKGTPEGVPASDRICFPDYLVIARLNLVLVDGDGHAGHSAGLSHAVRILPSD